MSFLERWDIERTALLGLASLGVCILGTTKAAAWSLPETARLVEAPRVVAAGIPFELEVNLGANQGRRVISSLRYTVRDTPYANKILGGVGTVDVSPFSLYRNQPIKIPKLILKTPGNHQLRVTLKGYPTQTLSVWVIPSWMTLAPPLIAILLALLLRNVFIALGISGLLGVFLIEGYHPISATLHYVDGYLLKALSNPGHASSILAVLVLGALIGLVTRTGGGAAMAQALARRSAYTKSRVLLATWLSGIAVFFDDYANALFVGTSMRPVTDRLRISREKLAFVVDATSAPVASLALISSWAAIQVESISSAYGEFGASINPYSVLVDSLPYRFYPLLMLFFVPLLIFLRRDFGPMWKAERRAVIDQKPVSDEATPTVDFVDRQAEESFRKWDGLNVVIPMSVLVLSAAFGMYFDGAANLREARARAQTDQLHAQEEVRLAYRKDTAGEVAYALGKANEAEARIYQLQPSIRASFRMADSTKVLLWASVLGFLVAYFIARIRSTVSPITCREGAVHGVRSMLPAAAILLLAWVLSAVCKELGTARYLVHVIGADVPLPVLPATVFAIGALVSVTTGSAWGSMAVLFPIVVPLASQLDAGSGELIVATVGAVLSAVVFGDHCSPISDTTIISSIACSCDHRDHVRTQLPYAFLVGGVGFVFGELATGFALYPAWVGLLVSAAVLALCILIFGRPSTFVAHGRASFRTKPE